MNEHLPMDTLNYHYKSQQFKGFPKDMYCKTFALNLSFVLVLFCLLVHGMQAHGEFNSASSAMLWKQHPRGQNRTALLSGPCYSVAIV